MNKLDQRALDYLASQRVCVLAVEMPDGSPHAATVHFAHIENPFVIYLETSPHSRKAEAFSARPVTRASLVVGSSEEEMKTLQVDGTVRLLVPEERESFDAVYLGRFPGKKEKTESGVYTPYIFTPTWWRFTDFKAPTGKLIVDSTSN